MLVIKKHNDLLAKQAELENLEEVDIVKNSIQKKYAEYLINNNDNMISLMLKFEELAEELEDSFKTEAYYETLEELSLCVIQHNELLKGLYENEPNEDNSEYQEVYDALLKAHAFYIQGQSMKMEYYYDNEKIESKTNGETMSNVVGNLIIELNEKINDVNKTNIPYKYGVNKEIDLLKPDN